MTALAAMLGVGVGLGVVCIVAGLRAPIPSLVRQRSARRPIDRLTIRLALGLGAGLAAGALTGWPVLALFSVGLGVALPDLIGGRRTRTTAVARIEAVAAWAEMLRDTMAGAAGIEGAIRATAPVAPLPIRAEVVTLAARLQRERLAPVLLDFAEEVADPTCDLVVAALVLASQHQARQLGELLSALARSAREDATMRLRVATGRARTQTAVRVIVGTTMAMAGGLVLLNRDYLRPYDSALGQLVLLGVGGCFAGAFAWLTRMAREAEPQRLLLGTRPQEAGR